MRRLGKEVKPVIANVPYKIGLNQFGTTNNSLHCNVWERPGMNLNIVHLGIPISNSLEVQVHSNLEKCIDWAQTLSVRILKCLDLRISILSSDFLGINSEPNHLVFSNSRLFESVQKGSVRRFPVNMILKPLWFWSNSGPEFLGPAVDHPPGFKIRRYFNTGSFRIISLVLYL